MGSAVSTMGRRARRPGSRRQERLSQCEELEGQEKSRNKLKLGEIRITMAVTHNINNKG